MTRKSQTLSGQKTWRLQTAAGAEERTGTGEQEVGGKCLDSLLESRSTAGHSILGLIKRFEKMWGDVFRVMMKVPSVRMLIRHCIFQTSVNSRSLLY